MNTENPLELFDLISIASVTPQVEIANPAQNVRNILHELDKPEIQKSSIVVFPELSLTGYTCGDLFFQENLISNALASLLYLNNKLTNDRRFIVVGLPIVWSGRLYNCAAVIVQGKILGLVPKTNIPNYQEFYEKRWFYSGENIINQHITANDKRIPFGTNLIFNYKGVNIGIEICEDLWVPNPPSSRLCVEGAEIILNLSATDDNIGKYKYIKSLVKSQSARCRCAYAYSSAGRGESSTDLVFSGINLIAYDGNILAESERFSKSSNIATAIVDIEKIRNDRRKFSTFYSSQKQSDILFLNSGINKGLSQVEQDLNLKIDPSPFVPSNASDIDEACKEIINIQSWGLAQRLEAAKSRNLVVGISGGLDSTLAILIAHKTFINSGLDLSGITGVTMPSGATSSRTYNNAISLIKELGVSIKEISITQAFSQHLEDIEHDSTKHDVVYENAQARERTQILMDLANKLGGMVLGTGDMSELALGWCTYNGDHMSMYNVNAGIPKTLVKYLVCWFARISDSEILKKTLYDIVDTPISPELIPSDSKGKIAQKTEELVGPYELHDFFLFNVLRNGFGPKKILFLAVSAFKGVYEEQEIKKWLIIFYKRFFSQQFKRSCMPDGPKVGSVCLSPRGDWRMPSDASVQLWLSELDNL